MIYENLLETNPELAKKVTTGVYEKDAISISEDIEKLYLTFYTPFESSILFDFHMKQLETKLYMDINEIFFYADGLVKNKFKTIEDLGEIELTFDSIKNYVYQKYIQKEDKIKQTMN